MLWNANRRALCCGVATALSFGIVAAGFGQCETQVIQGIFGMGHQMHTDGERAVFAQGVQVNMKVHVYLRERGEFVHEATIDVPHLDTMQQNIISAVQVAGDWIVIGDEAIGGGRFHVYRRIDGKWTLTQTITPPPGSGPDFGQSAAIDGTRMLLAVNGWAAVFELEGDQWVHKAHLPNPDAGEPWSGHGFGWSSALSGNRAVLGAIWADKQAGRVYVFDRGSGEWTHSHTFEPDPNEAIASLGYSVAIAGDLVLALAPWQERLYIFGPNDESNWIDAADLPVSATFGTSMSGNAEGTRAIVGGACEDGNATAFLFAIEEVVEFKSKLVGSDCVEFSFPGFSTTIAGDYAMLGYDFFAIPGTVHVFSGIVDDGACAACPADLTGSGNVGVPDLLALLGAWGPCANPKQCPADLTGSGTVGVPDLLELLAHWGACP